MQDTGVTLFEAADTCENLSLRSIPTPTMGTYFLGIKHLIWRSFRWSDTKYLCAYAFCMISCNCLWFDIGNSAKLRQFDIWILKLQYCNYMKWLENVKKTQTSPQTFLFSARCSPLSFQSSSNKASSSDVDRASNCHLLASSGLEAAAPAAKARAKGLEAAAGAAAGGAALGAAAGAVGGATGAAGAVGSAGGAGVAWGGAGGERSFRILLSRSCSPTLPRKASSRTSSLVTWLQQKSAKVPNPNETFCTKYIRSVNLATLTWQMGQNCCSKTKKVQHFLETKNSHGKNHCKILFFQLHLEARSTFCASRSKAVPKAPMITSRRQQSSISRLHLQAKEISVWQYTVSLYKWFDVIWYNMIGYDIKW